MSKKAATGSSGKTKKKTIQGNGKFTKRSHNKKSRKYKKPYRGQGR